VSQDVDATRLPPHNLGAEQAVLGGMMQRPVTIGEVTAVLTAEDYYRPQHQDTHRAIAGLSERGAPVDPVTVSHELARHGIKGVDSAYMHTLYAAGIAAASPAYHAGIVRDLAERRRAMEAAVNVLAKAPDTAVSMGRVREILRGAADPASSGVPAGDAELLAGVRDGGWLSSQVFPRLRYAVDGLVPEGLTLLIGPPKAGKSWLALGLLLAVASGGIALSAIQAGPARRVLYLALEDGDRRMQDRCRALLGKDEVIPAEFAYQTRILPGAILATITAWMRRYPDTAMIVVDTLGKVMPQAQMGESAYQRDYRVGSDLKQLADDHPGLAVVVLHHDRKAASEDFVDSVSGTHGLAGAADTIVVLVRKRQAADGSLLVTGRDVPENEYALTMTDGKTWQLAAADLSEAASVARQRSEAATLSDKSGGVLALVNRHPGGIAASDVVDVFGKDAHQYLGRLTKSGHIAKVSRGKYAPVSVSDPSGVSDNRSRESDTPDTSDGVTQPLLIASHDPSLPNPLPDCGHPACVDALAGECLTGRGLCLGCGTRLNPVLAAAGETTHPNCEVIPGGGRAA
jgi:hypothetical protein